MIKLTDVCMGYLTGRDVLKDISFSLPTGSFTFLVGPSGAGKSSLLSLLSLRHLPSKGHIEMLDTDITTLEKTDRPFFRRRIGLVLQDFQLLNHLTVAQNVALPLKVAGEDPKEIKEKVHELIEWVGLESYMRVTPNVLSGGQKQRVAIARAVITQPEILLADEPSGNLDHSLAHKFMHLFETLNRQGTTVLYATHDTALIQKFPHPTIHLKDGRLHELGK